MPLEINLEISLGSCTVCIHCKKIIALKKKWLVKMVYIILC